MSSCVRTAELIDVPAIAALTRAHRHRLASWAPRWWAPSIAADEIHPLWLEHLVRNGAGALRVVVSGGEVVGCVGVMPQGDQWFIDDVAVVDESMWTDVGAVLVRKIPERPALSCVATADRQRAEAFEAAGSRAVSSYWIRPTETGPFDAKPIVAGVSDQPRPAHTFGGAFAPAAPGALACTTAAGSISGSPSVTAPPVYDPGGTVGVIDFIAGDDLRALVTTALAASAARGDVLLNVVCGHDNPTLASALGEAGFDRTVEVHRWP